MEGIAILYTEQNAKSPQRTNIHLSLLPHDPCDLTGSPTSRFSGWNFWCQYLTAPSSHVSHSTVPDVCHILMAPLPNNIQVLLTSLPPSLLTCASYYPFVLRTLQSKWSYLYPYTMSACSGSRRQEGPFKVQYVLSFCFVFSDSLGRHSKRKQKSLQ